ncbi:MAG: hypothetical protein ABFE02_09245 [Sulfuricella sp.]
MNSAQSHAGIGMPAQRTLSEVDGQMNLLQSSLDDMQAAFQRLQERLDDGGVLSPIAPEPTSHGSTGPIGPQSPLGARILSTRNFVEEMNRAVIRLMDRLAV